MSRYDRKEFEVRNDLHLPKLTPFERSVLRVEMLLLNNSTGFFKSHIEKYLNSGDGVVDSVLDELGAKELNGFWVHPHYYHNVRDGFIRYHNNIGVISTEEIKLLTAQQIQRDPTIAVHKLLHAVRLHSPNELVQVLRLILLDTDERLRCHAASCYLFRHFGISHQVI